MTCRLCGKGFSEPGRYLERVNAIGVVPAEWECRPSCDATLSSDECLLAAVDGPETEG